MYPNTKIEIFDESFIPRLNPATGYKPLFMCAITSDKGEESLQVIDSDFQKRFGEVSFLRHGQPMLQANRIIDAGGKILVKRIVAPDATLANIIVVAKTKKTEVQKTNSEGELLYLDSNGAEVTTNASGETPIMEDRVIIKYEAQSIENLDTASKIDVSVKTIFDETPDLDGFKTYPLFTIHDNGRGVSNKKFRISPDYDGSKNINFLRYKIDIMENNMVLESLLCSFDPEKVYFNRAFSLETIVNKNSMQVKAKMYDEYISAFIASINEAVSINVENILNEDILFGRKRTSEKIKEIILDSESVNLTNIFGISLANGTNGIFGDSPISTNEYEDEVVKYFSGDLDDNIYDLVKHPIEAIIDANYPERVKRAIEALVTFREDVFFFGDMGFVYDIESMRNLMAISAKNKFCAYNHLSYDIIDPHTKKQIPVTVSYSLCKVLVNHLKNGRNRALSGVINEAVLEDAIEGTINYIPKVTPKVNQKQELDDMRVCYAGWLDNRLVLETQYTSQTQYTQLSFINNMLAMQEVIRAVRNRCPITRYSFIDGDDLEIYKNDVQAVLNKYSNNFITLEFEYIKDDIMVQNKIFYAAIRVKFRNYVQAEHFKIYTIG